MKLSVRKGFSFGLTSGIITTLGLLVGLYASTSSKMVILGGIITIAIADSMSDSLGIHMSEEETNKKHRAVWEVTIASFLTKFLFTLTFIVPILLFDLATAVIVSIIWGFFILIVVNYKNAKRKKTKVGKLLFEHLSIAALVIIITYYVGLWISNVFST